MRKNFFKRTLAGVLSAVTLVSSMAVSVPTAFAAEEDNKASAIEIKVGENYNVADKGVSRMAHRVMSGRCSPKHRTVRKSAHTAQITPRAIPVQAASRTP